MGLNSERRQTEILNILQKSPEVTVNELTRRFRVSEVTIRRDMVSLAKAGKLLRTYGGAIRNEKVLYEFSFDEKVQKNINEKERIGKLAAGLIKEGDRILMDTGTTTLQIAKRLVSKKNITVITASLPIVSILSGNPDIKIILPGGEFQQGGFDLIGPIAERELQNISVDKSFQGTDGIDLKEGLYATDFKVARMSELMMKAGKEVIIVADSTKFNKKSLVLYGKLEKVDTLITSKGIDGKIVRNLKKKGIKVLLA